MARKFLVILYTKVSKNDQGNWVIEETLPTEVFFETEDIAKVQPKEVLKYLKAEKMIESADMRRVGITIGTDLIEVYGKKTLVPMCRLQKYIG